MTRTDYEFTIAEDDPPLEPMTPDEERDYWSGPGHIEFYVSANRPDVFEVEVLDYSGCAGGAFEAVGEDYRITEMLGSDVDALREGWTYTVTNLTVVHTRGDGWTTDDDSDYYHDGLVAHRYWWQWARQKVVNAWWFNIGWRIAAWRGERKA